MSAAAPAQPDTAAPRHSSTLNRAQIVAREDQLPAFELMRQNLLTELAPEGGIESVTFDLLLRAAWDLQRFRTLEADLVVNGLDPVLDDSATKTFDKIIRLANRAERTYYRALKELRTLQTNRALRATKLEPEHHPLVPAIASVKELTKRTHAPLHAEVVKMATEVFVHEHARVIRQQIEAAEIAQAVLDPNYKPPVWK